jgi:hypothetical protein
MAEREPGWKRRALSAPTDAELEALAGRELLKAARVRRQPRGLEGWAVLEAAATRPALRVVDGGAGA